MEELLVYSLLLCEGLAIESDYQNCLDAMFLEDPTNDILLELEFMSSKLKILYIRAYYERNHFNHDIFGKFLMRELKKYYNTMELKIFASRVYSLWKILPMNIQHDEPFWTLCYADDPLSWGDDKQTRELYERMLNYYSCYM